MTEDELRDVIRRDPASTALLFDFDGSLSPIVEDPAAATPADGALAMLERLAQRYARVAVVSGRPRDFLAARLGAHVDLSGVYGLETRIRGIEHDHGEAAAWRPVIAGVAEGASLPVGVVVEPKGLSLTVHFRQAPEAGSVVATWAADVAARTGLEVRAAKASFELHPPIAVDKGTSVEVLAEGCTTVVYVGDDIGDLPAFAALDRFAADGRTVAKVAAGSDELPAGLADAADLVVPGPDAVVELFRPLI